MKRPEGVSLARWVIEGLNLKTVVLLTVAIVTGYQTGKADVRVMAKHQEAQDDQIADQRRLTERKLDTATYRAEQREQAQNIADIKRSVGDIEHILMERK